MTTNNYWAGEFWVRPPTLQSNGADKVVAAVIAANKRCLPALQELEIRPCDLDFNPPPKPRVRHVALCENFLAIAVNALADEIAAMSADTIVALLGHEYGHVYYPVANPKERATKDEETEAESFAGHVLGRLKLPAKVFEDFVTTTKHRDVNRLVLLVVGIVVIVVPVSIFALVSEVRQANQAEPGVKGGNPYENPSQECIEAMQAVKDLRARLSVGINIIDYRKYLGDTNVFVQRYADSKTKSDVVMSDFNIIMASYKIALDQWEFDIKYGKKDSARVQKQWSDASEWNRHQAQPAEIARGVAIWLS